MSCNRYHLWAALDVHAFSKAEAVLRFSAEEDGMWVQWQDYARLKAEVDEARRGSGAGMGVMLDLNNQLVAENARLKAEVERLTFDPMTYLDDQGEWMPRHIHLATVERLKAEVERLTKAHSDALADFWAIHKGYFDLKAEVERMTAEVNYRKNMDTHIKIMADQYTPAKEGKPSV